MEVLLLLPGSSAGYTSHSTSCLESVSTSWAALEQRREMRKTGVEAGYQS